VRWEVGTQGRIRQSSGRKRACRIDVERMSPAVPLCQFWEGWWHTALHHQQPGKSSLSVLQTPQCATVPACIVPLASLPAHRDSGRHKFRTQAIYQQCLVSFPSASLPTCQPARCVEGCWRPGALPRQPGRWIFSELTPACPDGRSHALGEGTLHRASSRAVLNAAAVLKGISGSSARAWSITLARRGGSFGFR
jgi:hypothetical protein